MGLLVAVAGLVYKAAKDKEDLRSKDLIERLEKYEDIRCLREAKEAEKDADPISLTELKKTIVKKRKAAGKRS